MISRGSSKLAMYAETVAVVVLTAAVWAGVEVGDVIVDVTVVLLTIVVVPDDVVPKRNNLQY